MAVTTAEFLWREWVLGEGHYAGKGAKSTPRPNVGYGDPKLGQEPVPPTWWQRLEEFLAKRSDYSEPGRKSSPPADPGPPATGKVSTHFQVREFDCHDGRKVPTVALPALKRLVGLILEPLRAQFGQAHVLSGYRPADYNARIGGAQYSQHIYELTPDCVAADLIFAMGDPHAWYAWAESHLNVGGMGLYVRSGFVHFDNRPDRARWTG